VDRGSTADDAEQTRKPELRQLVELKERDARGVVRAVDTADSAAETTTRNGAGAEAESSCGSGVPLGISFPTTGIPVVLKLGRNSRELHPPVEIRPKETPP
jgi:hypothetical protein